MKKIIKWVLGLVAFVAVLLVLAIILLPVFFDPNDHKQEIQQMVAENVGREVELKGPIEWSVFPWVAINLNDVSIKNEQGFKGETLAEVERIAVRVKLLPLLQKQIKVGQIELQQPNINLQVTQSGKSNWQSIIEHIDSGEDSSSAAESSTDIEIRGISISNGMLNYKDAGADLEVKLTDLKFDSEAIKSDRNTAMSLHADVVISEEEISGELKAAWQASGLAEGVGMVMEFNNLNFSGHQASVPLSLDVAPKAVIDLPQDTLNFNDLKLQFGAMNLSTSVIGQQLSTNMSLSGQLVVDGFSLTELFTDLGSPLENEADSQFSGKSQWSMVGDRLQLNDLSFNLDESDISGDIDIRQLSQLRGQFNLSIDELNLDHYLPADSSGNNSGSSGSGDIDFGNLSGQIKMQQLIAAGVNLDDITLNIKTQGKNLTIEPLRADFYQGLIRTELKLQPDSATEKLQITHNMQDFQAGNLLTDLIGTDYLTGLGQLNADIKIDQPFSENPLQTANGRMSYRLTDGDVVGIDVFQIMQQSLSLLNKTEAAASNADLKTAFGLMEIDADINNGVLKTNTLKLNSPYFELKGDVEIDLASQTIKGTIKPMLTNIPEGVLDSRFEKLINTRIPVSLKGDLLSPSVSIDVAQLLVETQKSKIDEKKEELKEDLFDAILGKKKGDKTPNQDGGQPKELTEKEKKEAKKDALKRDLLEGLFKSKKDKTKKDGNGT